MTALLIATDSDVVRVEVASGEARAGSGLEGERPTCLAALPPTGSLTTTATEVGPTASNRKEAEAGPLSSAWCGTRRGGVFRSDDGGHSWRPSGLDGEHVMSLAVSPVDEGLVWAGTEPSALWRSEDDGESWERMPGLRDLPSSSRWAFPPRPETHHVRWIACHPRERGRLWLAIEAGALVSTPDGGESWKDRVPDGPWDTHELAIHPDRPETLRIAAGDGYYESEDGGSTWCAPRDGLEVSYLRSVAVDPGDPDVILVSASSRARTAYVAGHSDGRLYRRVADPTCAGRWVRVRTGWPEEPETIAPLLLSGATAGELWAADERGLHRSTDGGETWARIARLPETLDHLRGLARVG